MSRSPWREALDGQVRILRELRKPTSHIYLGRNGDLPEIRAEIPDPKKQASFQMEFGRTLSVGIETLVREAEPVYITYDIHHAVTRQIDRIAAVQKRDGPAYPPDPPVFPIEKEPLTEAMLPIPTGLIQFPGSGLRLVDVPSDVRAIPPGDVYISAAYFGYEPVMELFRPSFGESRYRLDCRTRKPGTRTGMGIVIFLDAQRSNFQRMSNNFGEHLVPTVLGEWRWGELLDDMLNRECEKAHADAVDIAGTQILMAATGTYLHTLFRLMLTRITRWGGVGLNRTETREAEREKLRPRVQVVTWRKANYQYPEGHIPVPKNWSCRWSVRPHYRHYKSGRTVLINRYVKGPADKPFRLPVQQVHIVKQ